MFLSKSTDTFVDQQADEADGHGGKENPDGGLPIPAAQGIAAQYRGDHRRQAADAGIPRVAQAPESASAQIFREMALRAAGAVALLGKDYSAKMPPVRPLERK